MKIEGSSLLLILSLLLMPLVGWADGTMELKGKVISFDLKTVEVADQLHVYTIKRSAIKNSAVATKNLKSGQEIDLWTTFDGIVKVKDLPPKK